MPTGIWAVIVACNRPDDLARLLNAIAAQTIAVERVVIVDNGTDPRVPALAAAHGLDYHRSRRNIGGAGGFALGMLLALTGGASMLWLWDDDGWPESPDCLATLARAVTEQDLAIAAPLVISADDPTRSSFGFRLHGRSTFDRARITRRARIDGAAHLFNGTLVPTATLDRFGIPDLRLFIRGDEVDFMYRVLAGGGRVATLTAAIARHPSSRAEVHPMFGGLLYAVYPPDRLRREMLFRNRGYLMRRHHRWRMLAVDIVRYGCFFLLRRRPHWAGYAAWWGLTLQGMRERLGIPVKAPAGAGGRPSDA